MRSVLACSLQFSGTFVLPNIVNFRPAFYIRLTGLLPQKHTLIIPVMDGEFWNSAVIGILTDGLHTCTSVHISARARTHTHTHAQIHTHTNTHTHLLSLSLCLSISQSVEQKPDISNTQREPWKFRTWCIRLPYYRLKFYIPLWTDMH
jgi:hypothetical protein